MNMSRQKAMLIVLGCLYTAICSGQVAKDSLESGDLYFGQKPPGMTPEIFAPGVVSLKGRYEYGISFSPDLTEVYFSTQKENDVADIHTSKLIDGKWQKVRKLNLTKGQKPGEMHPFVGHDGQTLYFTAYNEDFTDTKLWSAKRTQSGWGHAVKLDSPINDREVFYPTMTRSGTLYYTDIFKSKTYYAQRQNGGYLQPKELNIEFGLHPFISPAGDFVLVDAVTQKAGRKDKDIYVFFKNKDGNWSDPVNLGSEVNSSFYETVPSLSPDGKYLFFSRYVDQDGKISDFYWVSTDVIERLRPKN